MLTQLISGQILLILELSSGKHPTCCSATQLAEKD